MKCVLILTDFSAAARCAAEQALFIAAQMNAEIWLVNVYPITPYLPSVGSAVLQEPTAVQKRHDSMVKLNREVRRLERIKLPGQRPVVRPIALEGQLAECVAGLAHRKKSRLIAMGVSGKSYGDMLFSGDVKTVLQQVRCPILATPGNRVSYGIHHVLFATDLAAADEAVIGDLVDLTARLKARLTIGHVSPRVVIPDFAEESSTSAFSQKIKSLYPATRHTSARATKVIEGLDTMQAETGVDIIALRYRKHPFWYHLFHENPLKELLNKGNTSLLIFPDNAVEHD
ncbi:universal stress protein [Mucilaginibacter sp. 14171R-50]|uniref:universal stress protein n=1 Tax=Mucilaginibacter sp. 14171R-50 TaxID=2703789 RepID=UPI00138D3F87|nr:universal stress protein [Mucilaginibacter sp. 14171R-50]QHS55334.1 universal stress protein [Mucilaginibacter sp. 14171R-50]